MNPDERQRDRLPGIAVDNVVLWNNRNIYSPFDLQEGAEAELGVFLANTHDDLNFPRLYLEVEMIHHRSAFVGEIIIGDAQGIMYNDVDLKGMGFLDIAWGCNRVTAHKLTVRSGGEKTWGTWEKEDAFRERDIIEDLIRRGCRTNRIMSIIQLNEISLPEGELITVESAKTEGFIAKNETPVIGARVYRMRERVQHEEDYSARFFNKAKGVVEADINRTLTWEEYLNWFASTLGENLARVHDTHWHGFLSSQNVTLACEIVDFGFGEGSKKICDLDSEKQLFVRNDDISQAKVVVLISLLDGLQKLGLCNEIDKGHIYKLFDESYELTRAY